MSDPQHPPEKVEIKANVSDEDAESAAEAVGLRPRDAERRSIWFAESGIGLDAGRLALDARGIIIRLRKVIDGPDDCTVKLRGPQAPALSRYWAERFEIEGDWSGEKHLFSASLVAEVRPVASTERPNRVICRRSSTRISADTWSRNADPRSIWPIFGRSGPSPL